MDDRTGNIIKKRTTLRNIHSPARNSRKRIDLNEKRIEKDEWLRPRLAVQIGFVALIFWIGWEFVNFAGNISRGLPAEMSDRPPGIEGFLPISSLMELWLWLKSGIVLVIHPAGVVILGFALGSALLMRRGFCSWLCPIGTLSECITRIGIKIGTQWKPPKWLDVPLRVFKYILLVFFLYAILGMSSLALISFIRGDYNLVSDIKMLDFFSPPSRLTWSVLAILALLTLMLKNFWCRYACPYGALLGIVSKLSPMAIRRNSVTCTDCGLCDKVCPAFLPVATSDTISSEECLTCHQCSAVCPVKDCLQFSAPRNTFRLKPAWYGIFFLVLFLGSVGTAKLTGYWYGKTSIETYHELVKKADILDHPRSLKDY